jgi:signal transduction histidine kinase
VVVSWSCEDQWARVSVRDEGPGIVPADQTRIFEPFQRLPAASAVPGMGLGLSLVKAVAEGHGGHVTVESSPGAGSTFTLHLPVGSQSP